MNRNYCPCCSYPLLQHTRTSGIFWFCRHCWQEMPVLSCEHRSSLAELILGKSSTKLQRTEPVKTKVPVRKEEIMSEWIGVNNTPVTLDGSLYS